MKGREDKKPEVKAHRAHPKANALSTLGSSVTLSILADKSKQFEKDAVGNFVLKLYHGSLIQPDGLVPKETVRREFKEYVKCNCYEKYFDTNVNVGTLLRDNNFLFNTARGSGVYAIAMKRLFEYRNEKLKQFDESRINNHQIEDIFSAESADGSDPLESLPEVAPDAEEFPVIYQGGCVQDVVPSFTLTNLGCFICQRNFGTQSHFEDHVSDHGFESDFKCLSSYSQKKTKNIFEIIYRLCNQSHFFNFTMKTKEKDVVIEKIVVIKTRFMHYVKNNKVPYEISTDGIDSFLVDSHLFTIGFEQPIVVVYRYKFDKSRRFVEEHHFLRTEEFPQVHFPIRSCRVPYNKVMKTKYKLNDYYPTAGMKKAQKDHFSDEALCEVSESFRKYFKENKDLNAENMCEVLKDLLQIEDLDGMKDYVQLRQKAAKIKRFGQQYSVKLRGIPKHVFLENIVTPLDEIILTDITEKDPEKPKKSFFALVERVYYNQVCFKYDHSTICDNKLYDIILRPSRLSLKYQFRALELLAHHPSMRSFLFPSCNRQKAVSTLKLNLFNSTIESNPEQLQAVRNIAAATNFSAPYVIFGPPGTGKTSTIVEAVLQLWQLHPQTRILITAGSNSACDEVALRLCRMLIDLQPHKMNILRIYAKSNEKRLDNIEDILIEASNFYRGHFYPDVDIIRQYRIVVCTLSVVGKLVSAAIGSTFFTHVFIDECAASTVTEALVGWMGTSTSNTNLIISGDHKQLRPILKSSRASELGLDSSYMERLMNKACYAVDANGDYDRSIQSRLRQNFRSHPEIVRLYNHLYYDNQLQAKAKEDDTMWALQWHLLPNKSHPIIFHSVYGSCKKSGHSTSLCNELEINTVMEYVKDLMYFGVKGRKIEETDIGIISPYKKQYTRIREELDHRRWHLIEVGAVETFQGKEKPIIIVSTVRSFTKTLGFLDNPRRLNVILSRAKVLFIIIGNPRTLSLNEDFKYIIDECRRNKCTVGGFRGYKGEDCIDEKREEVNLKKSPAERPVLKHSVNTNWKTNKSLPKKHDDVKVVAVKTQKTSGSNTEKQIDETTSKLLTLAIRQETMRAALKYETSNSFASVREFNLNFLGAEEQRKHEHTPVRYAPVRSEPVRSAPVPSEPVRSEPVRSEPVRSEPVRSAPVQYVPVQYAPVHYTPVRYNDSIYQHALKVPKKSNSNRCELS